MEPLTDSQKLTLIETYMSHCNTYTAKSDLFDTLTIYGKTNYYIFWTILKHVGKIMEENRTSYVGLVILEPLMNDEITTNNMRHLLIKEIDEKFWILVLRRGGNKRGELFVKFKVVISSYIELTVYFFTAGKI